MKIVQILKYTLLLTLMISAFSCQDSKVDAKKKAKQNAQEVSKPLPKPLESLPDACSFVTKEQVGEIIGVDGAGITVKDGTSKKASSARSCFYKWEDPNMPNAGALVQIQANPLPEEFPDWATSYIKAKLQSGEKGFNGVSEIEYKYEKMEGVGIEAAYNFELSKYFWRTDDQHIYMIAFNALGEKEDHLKWATQIANLVSK